MEHLISNLKKRNIEAIYCQNKKEVLSKLLALVPLDKSIGVSGSKTLDEIGIIPELIERGNKVFNQYQKDLTREESLRIRNQGACADIFLSSANAITKKGEMVFLSAQGHRIAGIANAKQVFIIVGKNKIVEDIGKAMDRARNYVTPLNCKRLNWPSPCLEDGICHNDICLFPPATEHRRASAEDLWRTEYKRMCCQMLIIEAEISPGRLKVVLVGEELGF